MDNTPPKWAIPRPGRSPVPVPAAQPLPLLPAAARRPRGSIKRSRDGCDTCKRRRLKCDQTKPICQRCLSKDLTCSYNPPKTWMFNPKGESPPNSTSPNEPSDTDAAQPVQPVQPAATAASPSHIPTTAASPLHVATDTTLNFDLAAVVQQALPERRGSLLDQQLTVDFDDVALACFLQGSPYLLAGSSTDPMISFARDDMHCAASGSSIRLVGQAIALSALGSRLRRCDVQRRGRIAYMRCIRSMRATLLNWDASKTAELLLVMVLMVAYEYLEPHDPLRSHMHIDAAIRLAINHVPVEAMTIQQWHIMSLLRLWTAAYLNPISGALPEIPTPPAPTCPLGRADMTFVLERIWSQVILLRQSCIQTYALEDTHPDRSNRIVQIIAKSADLLDRIENWLKLSLSFNDVYQVHADYDYASLSVPIEELEVWPGTVTIPRDIDTVNDFGRAILAKIYASGTMAQAIKIQLASPTPPPPDSTFRQRDCAAWESRMHQARKTQLASFDTLCGLVPYMVGVCKDQLPAALHHLKALPLDGGAALTLCIWMTAVLSNEALCPIQKRWILGRMKKVGDTGVGGSSYYVNLGFVAFNIVPKPYELELLHTVNDTWQNSGLSRMPIVLQTMQSS